MTNRTNAQESNPVVGMTEQERAAWASRIKPARLERQLTQKEVADMAGVSRNTVASAEQGATIPQADKLWRVMVALDLGPDPADSYPEWVEEWIAVIAPLIQAIPQPPRNEVMTEVVMLLGNAAAGKSNVAALKPRTKTLNLDGVRYAASRREKQVYPETPDEGV